MGFLKRGQKAIVPAVGIFIILGIAGCILLMKSIGRDEGEILVQENKLQKETQSVEIQPVETVKESAGLKTESAAELSEESETESAAELSEESETESAAELPEESETESAMEPSKEIKAAKKSQTTEEIEGPEETEISKETEIFKETETPDEGDTGGVHHCMFESIETPPTCLNTGKMEEKCSQCGFINYEEVTAPLGHDFEKSIWETATCLKGGFYNNVCKRCGLVESITEEPLPHDIETVIVQEGNCMEDTIIRKVCKSCGQQVESDIRYTPQDHQWMGGTVDGIEVIYCKRCGVVQ